MISRMKQNWFYKTLFSYLPILFFVSSILFLLFFLAFTQNIKKSDLKSNRLFVNQIDKSIDNDLMPIDELVLNQMLANDLFRSFFNSSKQDNYLIFQLHQKLNNFMDMNPLINSIYIYRQSDQTIISNLTFSSLNAFADRSFIRQEMKSEGNFIWKGRRVYTDPHRLSSPTMDVVSLVRKYPFSTGKQGMIVVNVSIQSLDSLIAGLVRANENYIDILDANQKLIFSTGIRSRTNESNHHKHEITRIRSNYTGWIYSSGFQNGNAYLFFANFPFIWVVLGFLSMLVGAAGVVYVTRLNYKPIETIMNQINEAFITHKGELFNVKRDELRFIHAVIQDLIDQAKKTQSQYERDLIHIRSNFFKELLEGQGLADETKMRKEITRVQSVKDFKALSFCIIEIDHYNDFKQKYNQQDQYLLKIALGRAIHEMAQETSLKIWAERLSNRRLGMIHFLNEGSEAELELIRNHLKRIFSWVQKYLNFTVTIGMGGETETVSQLPRLYGKAFEALRFKAVLGHNTMINFNDIPIERRVDLFAYLEKIKMIAYLYRTGEPRWEAELTHFFAMLKDQMLSKEDLDRIMNYFEQTFQIEMSKGTEEAKEIWQLCGSKLEPTIHSFETVDEIKASVVQLLNAVDKEIDDKRANKTHHVLMQSVKAYIEAYYTDPNLSLNVLSGQFNLSTKYLSRIFKEEVGDNFMDYLVNLRIRHAKELLRNTDNQVQDIALQVGYLHSFSFIRVFKKICGMTPGEYRECS